ncbi:MAG: carboxypeptidase-like regulatory domain-containing protein, partial [Ruminococcus sp.]|nr:carboxypeptidase-like regulatory domain-containing protein [Ruminococcus sp.]
MNIKIKKRNLKKKIAFLLALSMISSCSGTVSFAEEVSDIIQTITDVNSKSAGRIDISLGSALLIGETKFEVTLKGDNGFSEKNTVTVGDATEGKISFSNLADGKYTITVKADGFADYSQDIDVHGKMYSVRITTGFCGGYSYEKGSLHSGVILIGDVDRDGDIDDDDKDILIDVIDGNTLPENCITDLNHDGETNLIDLTFFSKSYNTEKDTVASVEEFVSPDIVDVKISENTTVNGDIDKMLCGEDVISLSPSKNAPISEENPVSLEFDFSENKNNSVIDGITLGTGSDNPVAKATVEVTYIDDGEEVTREVEVINEVYGLSESNVYAEIDKNGNIQIHIGKQVAIKKVTLTITAMQKNNNLAEISKVEFVNGMESRIPEPEMDIPENLTAQVGSEQFVLNWAPCVNITGYEVLVKKGDTVIQTSVTALNSITIQGKEIEDYETYTVSVQSINGTWKSGYCDSINVTPKPNKAPDKPDGVGASGIYKGIEVSWKKGKGTQYYNLYYKVRNSDE